MNRPTRTIGPRTRRVAVLVALAVVAGFALVRSRRLDGRRPAPDLSPQGRPPGRAGGGPAVVLAVRARRADPRVGAGGRLQPRLVRRQPGRLRRLDRPPRPQGADRDRPALPARLVDPAGQLPAQRPDRRPRRPRRPVDLARARPARPLQVRDHGPLGRRQPRRADGGGGRRGRPAGAQGRDRDLPRRGPLLSQQARPGQRPGLDACWWSSPARRTWSSATSGPARSSPRPRRSRSTARSSSSTGATSGAIPQFRADHLAPTGGHISFDTGDGLLPGAQMAQAEVNAFDTSGFWRIADLTIEAAFAGKTLDEATDKGEAFRHLGYWSDGRPVIPPIVGDDLDTDPPGLPPSRPQAPRPTRPDDPPERRRRLQGRSPDRAEVMG